MQNLGVKSPKMPVQSDPITSDITSLQLPVSNYSKTVPNPWNALKY